MVDPRYRSSAAKNDLSLPRETAPEDAEGGESRRDGRRCGSIAAPDAPSDREESVPLLYPSQVVCLLCGHFHRVLDYIFFPWG